MNLLIVYTRFPIGGIETFILRLSEVFNKNNIRVKVLLLKKDCDDNLIAQLRKFADVFFWDDYLLFTKGRFIQSLYLRLLLPYDKRKLLKDLENDNLHVHVPDMLSVLFFQRISKCFSNFKLSTGVYHINEFNYINDKWFFSKTNNQFIKSLPSNNFLFFNEISQKVYENIFQRDFKESIISPIGIKFTNNQNQVFGLQNNRIVSIGRLASWKKYNYHMIDVIEQLNNLGIKMIYDSFGDGGERMKLQELVEKKNLNGQVFFHDSVPYSQMHESISNSLMFIGAGTALIEASSLGIPALIGIENEIEPNTFGFLFETSSYSYQENNLDLSKSKIIDRIRELLRLSNEEFIKYCEKSIERSKDFGVEITYTRFKELIGNSKNFNFHLSYVELIRYIFSLFVHKLFSKSIAKKEKNYFNRL